MNLKDLHYLIDKYDNTMKDGEKQWEEIHKLKSEEMNELDFQMLISQIRLDNKLITMFLNQDPIKCKNLIYSGANKEYLYEYVSNMDSRKLSMSQSWLLEDLHNIRRQKHFECTYDREISDSRKIDRDEYHRLLEKYDNKEEFTYEEQDMFLIDGEEYPYVVVDNRSGCMFVEEFREKNIAERFLHGENLESLRDEECRYEICVYETEEDYNKGNRIFVDDEEVFEEAKQGLKQAINLNNLFSGVVLDKLSGRELYAFYSNREEEKYKYIMKCDMENNNQKYKNQFLLVRNPNDLTTQQEIDLKGGFYFNCDYEIINPKLVKIINSYQELELFCLKNDIRIPEYSIAEKGFIVGGENGLFINKDLEAIDWLENIEDEEQENI